MSESRSVSRRSAMKALAAGTLAISSLPRQASANDMLNIGFIGVGGMGTGRLREFMRYDDVNVAAICDVDTNHLERARDLAEERSGTRPPGFTDYRNMLDRLDLDGVMIATPDHWHALPFIDACEAGVDVFVEKPLSHSINEGRAMVDAALANNRMTQMGNHIHSGSNYRRVVELVKSGNLGEINKVQCWRQTGIRPLGFPEDASAPADLDYDMWLGPAPDRNYNPNRSHFNFRYFWDYSGGAFMDFWCHIFDVAYWAMGPTAPLTISATGGRFTLEDHGETPDTMEALYSFPGFIFQFTLNPHGMPGYEEWGGIGCIFQGTEATLVTNYGENKVYVGGKEVPDFDRPDPYIPESPGHIRQFLDSIKTRVKPDCNVEYAHAMTKPGLLGNIAYRIGDTIHWDDENERAVGNHRANLLVNRKYRRPWEM